MPFLKPAGVVLALCALASCTKSPSGGDDPPVVSTPQVTGATLVAGGEGVLSGTALDQLPATFTVDGQSVTATSRTAAEIRFPMPAGRPCEVDRRPIAVQAGEVSYTGALSVPGVVKMEVGESRILPHDQLKGCMQFAADQQFVLSSLNPDTTYIRDHVDTMFTIKSWTAAGPNGGVTSQAPSLASLAAAAQFADHVARHNRTRFASFARSGAALQSGADPYSENPVPFDPRAATATVGDTVKWVDYSKEGFLRSKCSRTPEQVPSYSVVVAAVSTSGKTVIAVDMRSSNPAALLTPQQRVVLEKVANITDRALAEAAREVFNRDFRPLKGGGGRFWHIMSTVQGSGYGVDNSHDPQAGCTSWFPETAISLGMGAPIANEEQGRAMAAALIHEYGHIVDNVEQIRFRGYEFQPRPDWAAEAWAQTIMESAARIASGQPTDARHERLGADAPSLDFYRTGHGESPEMNYLGYNSDAFGGGRGKYEQGTRLLMYIRERWGDARIGSSKERLYKHLMPLASYDLGTLARLVGMDPTTLLDQWSLAEATDNLVTPSIVAQRSLPQIESWAPDGGPIRWLFHTMDQRFVVRAAHGNYAARYIGDRPQDNGKGLSLTFEDVRPGNYLVRITRLR